MQFPLWIAAITFTICQKVKNLFFAYGIFSSTYMFAGVEDMCVLQRYPVCLSGILCCLEGAIADLDACQKELAIAALLFLSWASSKY